MILHFLAAVVASAAPPAPSAADVQPAPKPAQTQPVSRFGAPALDDAHLRREAGRADIAQDARNNQVAGVTGSSVNGTSRTGAVTIDGNAFQNLSGLNVVNANTGNNVAMNGAMTVNVAINPNP